MIRRLAVVAALSVFGLSWAPAPPPPPIEPPAALEPLARYVPADVDLFVSIRNPDRFVASIRDGRIGEFLRDLGLDELLRDALPDLGSDASGIEVAVGFRLPQARSSVPEVYLLVSSRDIDLQARLRAWVDELEETLRALAVTVEAEESLTVFSFVDSEVFSVYATPGVLVVTLERGAERVAALSAGASFADTEAFEALHKASADEGANLVFYVRTRPLFALVHAALGGDAIEEEEGGVGDLLRALMAMPAVRRTEGIGAAVTLSSDDEVEVSYTLQSRR